LVLLFHLHLSLSASHVLTASESFRLQSRATCFNACIRERIVSSAFPFFCWSYSNWSRSTIVSDSMFSSMGSNNFLVGIVVFLVRFVKLGVAVTASDFDDDLLFHFSLITCCCVSRGAGGFIGDLFLERLSLNTRKAIATTMVAMRTMKIRRKATAIKEFALNDDYPCPYNRLSVSILGAH
jgi:hypothetical protein